MSDRSSQPRSRSGAEHTTVSANFTQPQSILLIEQETGEEVEKFDERGLSVPNEGELLFINDFEITGEDIRESELHHTGGRGPYVVRNRAFTYNQYAVSDPNLEDHTSCDAILEVAHVAHADDVEYDLDSLPVEIRHGAGEQPV